MPHNISTEVETRDCRQIEKMEFFVTSSGFKVVSYLIQSWLCYFEELFANTFTFKASQDSSGLITVEMARENRFKIVVTNLFGKIPVHGLRCHQQIQRQTGHHGCVGVNDLIGITADVAALFNNILENPTKGSIS